MRARVEPWASKGRQNPKTILINKLGFVSTCRSAPYLYRPRVRNSLIMKNKATGTCVGKHDYQLQKEAKEYFNSKGILIEQVSFERHRGRVIIVCRSVENVQRTFLEIHPDFRHTQTTNQSYMGSTTYFLEFKQTKK
jgi:hypothetical protein